MAKRNNPNAGFDKDFAAFVDRLGEALHKRRRALGVTPDEVARISGIKSLTREKYKSIEKAQDPEVNIAEAARLCEVLGLSLIEIMGDMGKRLAYLLAAQRI